MVLCGATELSTARLLPTPTTDGFGTLALQIRRLHRTALHPGEEDKMRWTLTAAGLRGWRGMFLVDGFSKGHVLALHDDRGDVSHDVLREAGCFGG